MHMFCSKCGNEVSNQASFCNYCGAPIRKPLSSPMAATPAEITPQTNRPIPPIVRPRPESPVTRPAFAPGSSPNSSPPRATPPLTPIQPMPHPNTTIQNHTSTELCGMSFGEFILAFILFSIPIINVIVLLKWSFFSAPSSTHKNFARAILTLSIISLVLMLVFSLLGGGFFMNIL